MENRTRTLKETQTDLQSGKEAVEGVVILAGAIVPGKYVRGTPISQRETNQIIREMPNDCPLLIGMGSKIMASIRMDATQEKFVQWQSKTPTPHWTISLEPALGNISEEPPINGRSWASIGASSKAVSDHPDLLTEAGQPGPLVYEVELYQGCVRYKRGCKFCIEPKKGVPVWRMKGMLSKRSD